MLNAIKLRIYIQIVILTKACPHESGDGYPETLDSRFHGNDMNYFLNLMALQRMLGRVKIKYSFCKYYQSFA